MGHANLPPDQIAILVVPLFANLVATVVLIRYLKRFHTAAWADLGSPFLAVMQRDARPFMRFLWAAIAASPTRRSTAA